MTKPAGTVGSDLVLGHALVPLHYPEFPHQRRWVVLAISVFKCTPSTVNSCSCVCCREGRNSPGSVSFLLLVSL